MGSVDHGVGSSDHSVNTYTGDGVLQKDVLDSMPAVEETQYVRHVRFDRPLKVMMEKLIYITNKITWLGTSRCVREPF